MVGNVQFWSEREDSQQLLIDSSVLAYFVGQSEQAIDMTNEGVLLLSFDVRKCSTHFSYL